MRYTEAGAGVLAGALMAVGLLGSPVQAQVFVGQLSGSQEVPPVDTPGTGTATVTIMGNSMNVNVFFSALLGNTTVAHIHCCAPVGVNVGVATPLPTFPGFPAGVTAGVYEQIFDLALASSYSAAFLNANNNDPLQARDALVTAMLAGNTYFNIHTNLYPGGEIRGQLFEQTAVVPEPASMALLGTGLAGLAAMRRRRRRKLPDV